MATTVVASIPHNECMSKDEDVQGRGCPKSWDESVWISLSRQLSSVSLSHDSQGPVVSGYMFCNLFSNHKPHFLNTHVLPTSMPKCSRLCPLPGLPPPTLQIPWASALKPSSLHCPLYALVRLHEVARFHICSPLYLEFLKDTDSALVTGCVSPWCPAYSRSSINFCELMNKNVFKLMNCLSRGFAVFMRARERSFDSARCIDNELPFPSQEGSQCFKELSVH